MFGLGAPELLVIAVIALIIFGPDRLPELGKNAGKAIRSFKEGAESIKTDVENSTGMDEKTRRELTDSLTMKDTREEMANLSKDLKESVSLETPPDAAPADKEVKTEVKEEIKEEVKSS